MLPLTIWVELLIDPLVHVSKGIKLTNKESKFMRADNKPTIEESKLTIEESKLTIKETKSIHAENKSIHVVSNLTNEAIASMCALCYPLGRTVLPR